MEPIRVGKILGADATPGERDAIHIAVITAEATESLRPGVSCGLLAGTFFASSMTDPIGIVDPFLTKLVRKGQKFRIFLTPNTITGLRHLWTHPTILDERPAAAIDLDSPEARHTARQMQENLNGRKLMVLEYCKSLHKPYDELMDDLREVAESGDNKWINTDVYDPLEPANWRTIWEHFENITGLKKPEDIGDYAPYSCSC